MHWHLGGDAAETEGADLGITHYKLPLIGCYRHGPEYRAYGLQLGVQALDIAALAIAYHHPQIAAGVLLGTRFMGSATIYATDLKRKFLAKKDVTARWWSDLFHRRNPEVEQQSCEASLTDASQEPETPADEE